MNAIKAFDMKIVFGDSGHEVTAYSDFLRAESEVLNDVIPLGNPKPDIILYGVGSSIFCDALKCICSYGKSVKSVAHAVTLRAIGKGFKMKRLLTFCEKYLVKNLNAQNVGEVYELACQYCDECIQYFCWRIFDTQWRTIFANNVHYKYSFATMMRYVLRPIYRDIDEYVLWTAVYNWSLNQSNCDRMLNPREALKEFLPHIRFLTMRMEELKEVFKSNVLTDEECDAIIKSILTLSVTDLPQTICREIVPRRGENQASYTSHISHFYIPKHSLLRITKKGDSFYSEVTVKRDCFLTGVELPLRGFTEPLSVVLEITKCSRTNGSKSYSQKFQLLTHFLNVYPPHLIKKNCTICIHFAIFKTNPWCFIEPHASCNISKSNKRECEEAEEWKSFYISDVLFYF